MVLVTGYIVHLWESRYQHEAVGGGKALFLQSFSKYFLHACCDQYLQGPKHNACVLTELPT